MTSPFTSAEQAEVDDAIAALIATAPPLNERQEQTVRRVFAAQLLAETA